MCARLYVSVRMYLCMRVMDVSQTEQTDPCIACTHNLLDKQTSYYRDVHAHCMHMPVSALPSLAVEKCDPLMMPMMLHE